MGQSTDGILVYGFDLGGDESGWKVEGADEYGEWSSPWLRAAREEAEDFDIAEAIEKRLLALVGFTEEWGQKDGYWERKREAEKQACKVVSHCSGEYQMYLLAAWEQSASRGTAEVIDFDELERRRVEEDWDGKLAAALTDLDITPKDQPRPRWLLASYWG